MTRRDLLAGAATMLPLAAMPVAPLAAFRSRITKARISAITDEVADSQTGAIDFAAQYGLQWVELRNVPETKKEFAHLAEPELKKFAAELGAAKLKVSYLNTSMMKFAWPGLTLAKPLTPDAATAAQKRWDNRLTDLSSALLAANILGVDKIRVFTGERSPNPETTYLLIVRTLEEMIPLAEKAKVRLVIENEFSQNIGTSAESKDILALLPSKWIGLNWDPQNSVQLKEMPWPDGYAQLPKNRLMNVQFKAEGLLDGPGKLNWKAIMNALQKDNYQGILGLETHGPADKRIENAHASMKEIMHLVGELD